MTFYTKLLSVKTIAYDEIDYFNEIYDGIRYLVLFGSGLCDAIYRKIRYLISGKSGITDSINHNLQEILPIEKTLTFHNVIILIKSVIN